MRISVDKRGIVICNMEPADNVRLESTANVPLGDIMSKLKLSRNYITRNISHVVKQVKVNDDGTPVKGSMVVFDGKDLRKWLINKATFTRQTRRIDLDAYMQRYHITNPKRVLGMLPPTPDKKDRLSAKRLAEQFDVIMSETKRSAISPIEVEPFDFFDKKLIFPKEYYHTEEDKKNGKKASSEICYRDMYLAGAIKIQLGLQKTMFYIPEEDNLPPLAELVRLPINSPAYPLVTADWEPGTGSVSFYKKMTQGAIVASRPLSFGSGYSPRRTANRIPNAKRKYRVTVEFNPNDGIDEDTTFALEAIKRALQKGLRMDREDALEIQPEKNHVSASYIMHFPKRGPKRKKH